MVQYKADLIIISLKINLFLPWYSWKIGVKQQSLTLFWNVTCQLIFFFESQIIYDSLEFIV
jgi:hypothetical protein